MKDEAKKREEDQLYKELNELGEKDKELREKKPEPVPQVPRTYETKPRSGNQNIFDESDLEGAKPR